MHSIYNGKYQVASGEDVRVYMESDLQIKVIYFSLLDSLHVPLVFLLLFTFILLNFPNCLIFTGFLYVAVQMCSLLFVITCRFNSSDEI